MIGACIDPIPCLILEFMSGGSLSQIIKERKIGDRIKIGFAIDIAAGLSFLHNEKKIIHRDIKPQNILVNKFK